MNSILGFCLVRALCDNPSSNFLNKISSIQYDAVYLHLQFSHKKSVYTLMHSKVSWITLTTWHSWKLFCQLIISLLKLSGFTEAKRCLNKTRRVLRNPSPLTVNLLLPAARIIMWVDNFGSSMGIKETKYVELRGHKGNKILRVSSRFGLL